MKAHAAGFKILQDGDARLTLAVDMTNVAEAVEVAQTQGKQILFEVTFVEVK